MPVFPFLQDRHPRLLVMQTQKFPPSYRSQSHCPQSHSVESITTRQTFPNLYPACIERQSDMTADSSRDLIDYPQCAVLTRQDDPMQNFPSSELKAGLRPRVKSGRKEPSVPSSTIINKLCVRYATLRLKQFLSWVPLLRSRFPTFPSITITMGRPAGQSFYRAPPRILSSGGILRESPIRPTFLLVGGTRCRLNSNNHRRQGVFSILRQPLVNLPPLKLSRLFVWLGRRSSSGLANASLCDISPSGTVFSVHHFGEGSRRWVIVFVDRLSSTASSRDLKIQAYGTAHNHC